MDQKVERLFRENNLIFIATINLDGSPQLTPVWGDYQDGHILVNTAEGRIKHRNVLHDSRVAVCVVSHDNPLDMTTIRGKVISIFQIMIILMLINWPKSTWTWGNIRLKDQVRSASLSKLNLSMYTYYLKLA